VEFTPAKKSTKFHSLFAVSLFLMKYDFTSFQEKNHPLFHDFTAYFKVFTSIWGICFLLPEFN